MSHEPQYFRSPSGDEMVVISRADYDDLIAMADADEDAADVEAYDAAMARLHADQAIGLDPLPQDVSAAILRGDSRLTAWRRYRELTQPELARLAEISQGFLSQIERHERKGTPETLARIALALAVSIESIA